MGNDSILTRGCWTIVDRLSRVLEPWEQDSVLGDLAECRATGEQALLNLLGLVIRRQTGSWTEWRLWLGLVGIVGPLAVLAGQHTVGLGGALAAYCFYRAPLEAGLVYDSLLLLAWAAASGFVVGSLSRQTIWTNATVFYLIWLAELSFGLKTVVVIYPMRSYYQLAGYVYRTKLLPLSLLPQLLLFVLPSLCGIRKGLRLGPARTPFLAAASVMQFAILALLIVVLVPALKALDTPEPGLYWRNLPHWQIWLSARGPTILILWPLVYMAGQVTRTHPGGLNC